MRIEGGHQETTYYQATCVTAEDNQGLRTHSGQTGAHELEEQQRAPTSDERPVLRPPGLEDAPSHPYGEGDGDDREAPTGDGGMPGTGEGAKPAEPSGHGMAGLMDPHTHEDAHEGSQGRAHEQSRHYQRHGEHQQSVGELHPRLLQRDGRFRRRLDGQGERGQRLVGALVFGKNNPAFEAFDGGSCWIPGA